MDVETVLLSCTYPWHSIGAHDHHKYLLGLGFFGWQLHSCRVCGRIPRVRMRLMWWRNWCWRGQNRRRRMCMNIQMRLKRMSLRAVCLCCSLPSDLRSQQYMTAAAGEDVLTFSRQAANTPGEARPVDNCIVRCLRLRATSQL